MLFLIFLIILTLTWVKELLHCDYKLHSIISFHLLVDHLHVLCGEESI